MSMEEARLKALKLARERLKGIDLKERCIRHGLTGNDTEKPCFRLLGRNTVLDPETLEISPLVPSDKPVKTADKVLVLHYLANTVPLCAGGQRITFRRVPGGQFYWQPFQSRSVLPLLSRIGNDRDLLLKNLDRFDWEAEDKGDAGARIHVLGTLYVYLVYRLGDEEFGPSLDVLFDAGIKDMLPAEDIAVIASRVCLGLL